MGADDLFQPLVLPCGVSIKNRFMKSAMSEGLATTSHQATAKLCRLYQTWAEGGAGLVITGNVMVDRKGLGEPRNVVLEDEQGFAHVQAWAQAGTVNGTHLWMQLNHPGKQSPKVLTTEPVAPSAIPLGGNLAKFFAVPRELTEVEIEDLIYRFSESARLAQKAGFTGVQIHGAHGYLVNQFLSPLHNQRTDRWGGSLENRMRFVVEIYTSIRKKTGVAFPIGIKINSADFQRGGFTEEESLQVIRVLSDLGIDLIEISGGTYESPVMTGVSQATDALKTARTREREAYFLQFAEQVRAIAQCPIAVTGGFRTPEAMRAAIQAGSTHMVGLARPFALEPQLPNKIKLGQPIAVNREAIRTGLSAIDGPALLETIWYEQQLERMGRGKNPQPKRNAWWTLIVSVCTTGLHIFQKRRSSASK